MITVDVTADDIAKGDRRDCYRCAVSLAVNRAVPDADTSVYQMDWNLWVQVFHLHIAAPVDVAQFVRDFDGLTGGEPFQFELPPFESAEWKERCYTCEELVQPSELDDEGNCRSCCDK